MEILSNQKIVRLILKFSVSVSIATALLVWFLKEIELLEVWYLIENANHIYILVAVIICVFTFLVRAIRWKLLLDHSYPVPLPRVFSVLTMAYTVSNLIPFRAGEILKFYLIYPTNEKPWYFSVPSVIFERALDFIVLGFGALFCLYFMPKPDIISELNLTMITFVCIGVIGLLLGFMVNEKFTSRVVVSIEKILLSVGGKRLNYPIRVIKNSNMGFIALRSHKTIIPGLTLSIFCWSLEFLVSLLLTKALSIAVPLLAILFSLTVANILVTVPSTPGGVGPFELATKYCFIMFGVSSFEAVAYAIVLHGVLIIPITAIGLIILSVYLSSESKRLARLRSIILR